MRLTPKALKLLLANEKIHAGAAFNGILDLLFVRLSTIALPAHGDVDPVTQFAVPAYAGYADLACAFGAEYLSNGQYAVDGPLLTFQQAGALTSTVVMGFGIYLPGAPDVIYGVENFDAPITLATLDDALKFVPQVVLGITTDIGKAALVS